MYWILGSHTGGYEEFCLLGYITLQSVDSLPAFRQNISPLFSGSNNNPSRKQLERGGQQSLWPPVFTLVGLLLDHEDRGEIFLRNVG
jgi:hypothetical protein